MKREYMRLHGMLQSTAYVKIFFFVSCMNISCKKYIPRVLQEIALGVHIKGSVVQKSMEGMQHSLPQRMLQTGQRAKGICKVKNSAIMQSLGMA